MSHTYKAEAIEELLADNARLESQNQALQEENESLGLFVKEAHAETLALQEALGELVEEMKHLVNHGGVGNHQAVFDKARNALSQETDPE